MSEVSLEQLNDKELVERIKHGNKKAFEILIFRYQPKIKSVVFSLLRNPDDAEDACQEIFEKFIKGINKYKFYSSFSTWLFRIVINHCKNLRRGLARFKRIFIYETGGVIFEEDDGTVWRISIVDNGNAFETNEIREKVREAIRALPMRYRAAVVLKDIEDISYEDVAEILRCPVGTVKSRVARGRMILKEKLRNIICDEN
ncbi:MAG: sigma-70 family RNA polymerase sigma factor [Bacteroidales bacterium]|nr:sigma-70 family RNA polymerase sigma factor [Bacteroidales bacterium]